MSVSLAAWVCCDRPLCGEVVEVEMTDYVWTRGVALTITNRHGWFCEGGKQFCSAKCRDQSAAEAAR